MPIFVCITALEHYVWGVSTKNRRNKFSYIQIFVQIGWVFAVFVVIEKLQVRKTVKGWGGPRPVLEIDFLD